MFDFLSMANNYESRKVQNDVVNGVTIDTAAVTDSDQPYETGIQHSNYKDGNWIIVEMYDTKDEAISGHKKWVETFRNGFPAELKDVSTATIASFQDSIIGEDWRNAAKSE